MMLAPAASGNSRLVRRTLQEAGMRQGAAHEGVDQAEGQ